MASIFTQMCCDAVCSCGYSNMRRLHRVGMHAPASIPHGRHMVNIDP
jgi:hypothetical protein